MEGLLDLFLRVESVMKSADYSHLSFESTLTSFFFYFLYDHKHFQ